MSTETLHLNIDRADGSLQRLIGLVERRGFHIDGMTLRDEGQGRRVELAVRGRDAARCPHTLGRQIDRLFGVTRIAAPAAAFHPEVAA
ncbi:MAG: ACT domain-containing protein [Brevundimonas sp.]|jgi:acetolactate synthase II small subunit|uniref:ACT domain-containing protein n=1 Tax=Brevundimonas sp. TaxID=1871086 RepID=UPI0030037B97